LGLMITCMRRSIRIKGLNIFDIILIVKLING
jgi:hypothetical protein